MPSPPTGNPRGRPEKPIDWEYVDVLLEAGCTGSEIASVFNIHAETFYDRVKDKYGMLYTNYAGIVRQRGDTLLRKAQYEKALDKDNTMLIWLGKHRLDQWEKVEKKETFSNDDLNDMKLQLTHSQKKILELEEKLASIPSQSTSPNAGSP